MSRARILSAALTVVACVVALVPAGAAQAVPHDGWFRIENIHTDKTLGARSNGNGVGVLQYVPVRDDGYQLWRILTDPDGAIRFVNAATSHWYALTISDGVDWVNRPVIVYTSNPSNPLQKWRRISTGTVDQYRIQNIASGRCLQILERRKASGVQVYAYGQQFCDENEDAQKWWFNDYE